jgi:archaellum component FlaC
MSNRVEELESKVSELQAAVNGLTEELVETRARLQTLEEELETDEVNEEVAASAEPPEASDEDVKAALGESDVETTEATNPDGADEEADGESETDGESTEDSDIIVA